MWRYLFLGVVFVLAASSASAAEFFVGRWASNASICTAASGDAIRPLILTEYSMHRSTESCRIGKMYKTGRAVHIQAYCSHDGRVRAVPVTLEERGLRLGVIWDGGQMEEMERCP